jgi:glucosamine--fructose-6-phosphate aminotransferase (isomerizing)
MCGIVAYIGDQSAVPILTAGLKKLEYRGYDSSGFAVIDKNNDIVVHKRKGKVKNMVSTIPVNFGGYESTIGIAHTRWATHGKPLQTNAHPHLSSSGKIVIVHNGIVENYESLKSMLKERGHTFKSDTDTEVLVNLIDEQMKENAFLQAVKQALKMISGTYGIVVMHKDHPEMLITARNSSPLVIGVGANEMIIASDSSAVVARTQRVIYLDDHEIAVVKKDDVQICDLQDVKKTKQVKKLEFELEEIELGHYKHFMSKEINEQPDSIERVFRGRICQSEGTVKLQGLNMSNRDFLTVERVCVVACGTAYYAGYVGKYMIESMTRVPVDIDVASEFRYRNPLIDKNTLYVVVSQSGETADTLAALREIQRKGGNVVAISNVVGSTIARETGRGVYIHAGPEISVASTKAFTSQVTTFYLLALLMARIREMDYQTGEDCISELERIPGKVRKVLKQEGYIADLTMKLVEDKINNFIFIGRNIHYPVALEGALKLKELAYLQAEALPAGELKHGPLALVDEKTAIIAIVPKDDLFDKTVSNLKEIESRGGRIISVTTSGNRALEQFGDVIYIPTAYKFLTPLLSVIPLQFLAYNMALLKGCDVDTPKNLAKSVTCE